MEMKDQGFRVGDEVFWFGAHLVVKQGVVASTYKADRDEYSVSVSFSDSDMSFTGKGEWLRNKPQTLFHRDAVTIDEHGRLTAINHDYVKPRAPKVVTKEPSEFVPFERVLGKTWGKGPWQCDFFSHFGPEHDAKFPYFCAGLNYAECIPFAGNEHLVGKVTE